MSSWDLGAFIANRQMPTARVAVYLNEYASHAKAQLLRAHGSATPDMVGGIDKKLDQVEKELEKSRYVIHLEAIPAQMREDINEESLKKYPLKTTLTGQISPEDQGRERTDFTNLTLWKACIRKLEVPGGDVFENPSDEDIEALEKGMPTSGRVAIDKAIKELHEDSERFTAEVMNPDF